jgi:hypothetical protein
MSFLRAARQIVNLWVFLCAVFVAGFTGDSSAQLQSAHKAAAPSSTKPVVPIQTQFKAFKVIFLANGQEELEPASGVSPGDVVAYVAVHRNVSQKRLLNTDFAIPIPYGTTLWQGSVWPAEGQLRKPDLATKSKELPRVVWRVERLEPGQSVQLKLRVSIDPDPTLAPPALNPFRPAKPELRSP